MSKKKNRKGSLGPVSSINRFGDVRLGLESGSDLLEMEHGFHDRDGHVREGSTTSVQEAASAKLVLETDVNQAKKEQIGVEGGKLKAGHGREGSTWQGICVTLMPPMLVRLIEKELVAENQAATLPEMTLNGGTGGWVCILMMMVRKTLMKERVIGMTLRMIVAWVPAQREQQ
ncbi:hypothetical protein AHAS_Ahas11G0177000 [Arachis hypogaea]